MLALSIAASPAELDLTFNSTSAKTEGFGFSKAESYDVAVHLTGADLAGKRILGFSVPVLAEASDVSGISGWISEELLTTEIDGTTINLPLVTKEGILQEDGVLNITFDTPYEIPEGGAYVGYSFAIGAKGQAPIAVAEGRDNDGFMLRSSETQKKWADYSKRKNFVSAISVRLEGEFKENAAVCNFAASEIPLSTEAATAVIMTVTNHGSEPIESVTYSYAARNVSGYGEYTFATAIPAVYGRSEEMSIEIPALECTGIADLTVEIEKVNGIANSTLDSADSSAEAEVYLFVPVKRPLVEEYTGLNCGFCPSGYVMMEQGKLYYPGRFVALSYHSTSFESSDNMCSVKTTDFPIHAGGYPYASVNRSQSVDPNNVLSLWRQTASGITTSDIAVELSWADETRSKLIAKAKTRFIKDFDTHGYKLSFAVVADGLSNEKWIQSNYYGDEEPVGIYAEPFWDLFVGQPDHLIGLEFNDIVVHYEDIQGIPESLPESLVAGETYEYTYEVNTSEVVNLAGNCIVNDFGKVRVVGIVLNNGVPSNCVSSGYADTKESVAAMPDMVPTVTVWSDMQGRRIANPSKGMFIRTYIFTDGSVKSEKICL